MGATRYHGSDNEALATRRHAYQEKAAVAEASNDNKNQNNEDAEESRMFLAYMAELQQTHYQWTAANPKRPNFKDIGLHLRALQNAGVVENSLKCFRGGSERHQAFREDL